MPCCWRVPSSTSRGCFNESRPVPLLKKWFSRSLRIAAIQVHLCVKQHGHTGMFRTPFCLAPPPQTLAAEFCTAHTSIAHGHRGGSRYTGHKVRNVRNKTEFKPLVHSSTMRKKNIKSTKKRKLQGPPVILARVMLQHSSFRVMGWKSNNRGPPFFLGLHQRKL